MTSTAIHSPRRAAPSLPATVADCLLRCFRPGAAQRELRSLSATQLHDAGIDPAAVAPQPVFEVDAVTMSRLMSLR